MGLSAHIRGEHLQLQFPYNERLVNKIRQIPNRRWDDGKKQWSLKISLEAINFVISNGFELSQSDLNTLFSLTTKLEQREFDRKERVKYSKSISAAPIPEIASKMKLPAWDYQWGPVHYATLSDANFLLADDMALGKAQPVSEPVLTPQGWVPIGSLKVGDFVIGSKGIPIKVTKIFPQQSRKVFRVIFSDKSSTRCSPEHLWEVCTGNDLMRGTKRVMTTQELLNSGLRDGANNRKYRIPIISPVTFSTKNLPIEPYTLGVILGDGSVNSYGYVNASTDKEIALIVGHNPKPNPNCDYHGTFYASEFRSSLKQLGLASKNSHEKFVPPEYLLGDIDQRKALLAGLLDTDGSPIEKGGVEFSSTSKKLIEAVIELTQSLGGTATKGKPRHTEFTLNGQKKKGKLSFRVNIKVPFQPFRLSRKASKWVSPLNYSSNKQVSRLIESIIPDQDEETVCIMVDADDHLYVTREYILTHNSVESLMITQHQKWSHKPVLIVTPVPYTFQNELQKFFGQPSIIINGDLKSLNPRIRYYICSYDRLKNLFEDPSRYKPRDFIKNFFIIFDECHLLKNRQTKRNRFATALAEKVENKICMTGTPVVNRPDELYEILKLIDKDFMSWTAFMRKYCGLQWTQWGMKHDGATNLQELNQYLYSNTMVRREKEQVLSQLPEKVRDSVELKDQPEDINADSIFELFAQSALLKSKDPDFKDYLTTVFDEAPKVGVFCYHKAMIAGVEDLCKEKGIGYVTIDGDTPADQRQHIANQFANDPSKQVAILSLAVAGTGLNGLQAANVCVFAELFWTPGVILQAENRFHRPGLKNSLLILFPIFSKFEHSLCRLLLDKIGVIRRITGIEQIPDSLSNETLLQQIAKEFDLPLKSKR